jgi:hypothetical protein
LKENDFFFPLGVRIIRLRILKLLDVMFELDIRHYCATLLHPRYRQLKGCSNVERDEAHRYIRAEMIRIVNKSKQPEQHTDVIGSPLAKKRKFTRFWNNLKMMMATSIKLLIRVANQEVKNFRLSHHHPMNYRDIWLWTLTRRNCHQIH